MSHKHWLYFLLTFTMKANRFSAYLKYLENTRERARSTGGNIFKGSLGKFKQADPQKGHTTKSEGSFTQLCSIWWTNSRFPHRLATGIYTGVRVMGGSSHLFIPLEERVLTFLATFPSSDSLRFLLWALYRWPWTAWDLTTRVYLHADFFQ